MDSSADDKADVQVDTLKNVAMSCDTIHDVDECCANDTSNYHNVVNDACENFHDNVDAGGASNGEEVIKIATKKNVTKNHDGSLFRKVNTVPEATLMALNAGASIGDNYLAGKLLIESSSKVVFDSDAKKYTAFRHGINRVIGIYGSQFSLIFDILLSRCSGKALEAIRCCDRIEDPEVAVKIALDKLARYFGSSSQIIEAHIFFITRADLVR